MQITIVLMEMEWIKKKIKKKKKNFQEIKVVWKEWKKKKLIFFCAEKKRKY